PFSLSLISSFFFKHTSTTPIYTLSLHDALPIFPQDRGSHLMARGCVRADYIPRPRGLSICEGICIGVGSALSTDDASAAAGRVIDRKSTRLNSSHEWISYAVFCLKKKREEQITT